MQVYDEDCLFGSGYTEVLTVDELMEKLNDTDKKTLDSFIDKFYTIKAKEKAREKAIAVTDKQLAVIEIICENLHIEYPDNLTKQSAIKFISDNIDKSKKQWINR